MFYWAGGNGKLLCPSCSVVMHFDILLDEFDVIPTCYEPFLLLWSILFLILSVIFLLGEL